VNPKQAGSLLHNGGTVTDSGTGSSFAFGYAVTFLSGLYARTETNAGPEGPALWLIESLAYPK